MAERGTFDFSEIAKKVAEEEQKKKNNAAGVAAGVGKRGQRIWSAFTPDAIAEAQRADAAAGHAGGTNQLAPEGRQTRKYEDPEQE